MATLGTQLISTSYTQLIKTLGTSGLDGSLQVITDGDDTQSALSLSTSAVSSTGSFSVVGSSTFTGAVTCSNTLGVTGAATLSSSLGVTGAVTLSSTLGVTGAATLSSTLNVTGAVTLSSSFTASTGTATIGTATISTATISTATIGATTFTTGFTSSTGTNTLGTIASTTINNTGLVTVGSLEVGGSAGPILTKVSYGTAAFTLSTVNAHNVADTTTGTFALTGCALGDIVFGSISTLGAATGTVCLAVSFYPQTTDVARYSIINKGATAGTISAGTIYATAMRFTA